MNKTLLITGGSSGIGLSIVKRFLKGGFSVINFDIAKSFDHSQLQNIACDLLDKDTSTKALEQVLQREKIDAFVSNAGVHLSANIESTDEQAFDKVFDLNVKSAYRFTQKIVTHMKGQGGGVILYIGSDQSIVAKRNSFAYNLSKHALLSMAKTTALDYADFNIRSNLLCPGTIDTPLYHQAIEKYCQSSGEDIEAVHKQEAALQPLNRIGKAQEVAELTWFLASDHAGFITGSALPIDGGYTAQ